MIQLVHDFSDHDHKVFLVLYYIGTRDRHCLFFHFVAFRLQDCDFQAEFDVQLDVVAVLSRDILVHFRILILALAFILLQQMVFFVYFFAALLQHARVLESAVEYYQSLHGDCPVVCVRYMPGEHAFNCIDRRDLLRMVTIEALENV